MGKKINVRPQSSVYATYKNIKYDPWTAIAEFVDNSTQSFYDNEKRLKETKYWRGLNVDIVYDRDEVNGDKLVIRDNAYGMNYHDFERAIMLDSPPKKSSRSEFGMGLKTAACWFGKKWSVETIELGSGIKYSVTVDVERLRVYKDEEIDVEETSCSNKEHGTVITIWDLNRTITGRQIGKTKDQLRGMYRVDLRTGEISIKYNGTELVYEEPAILHEALPNGTEKIWKKELSFSIPYENRELSVNGYVALRETASTSAAGFALIRRGRVIIGGYENAYRPEEVFEKSNSFVYQRLFGELNLDDWPVTQTKDAFDWYNGLEDALIEKLNELCSDYKDKAKKYRVGKRVSIEDGFSSLVDVFSSSGVIENVTVQNIDHIESSDDLLEEISNTVIVDDSNNNDTGNRQTDIEIEGADGKSISFELRGHTYVFNVFLRKDDPNQQWLYITPKDNVDEYDIEWNIRHPFFKPYIDEPDFLGIMEQFVFALSLAEIESMVTSTNGMVSASTVRLKMNDILKSIVRR